MILFNGDLLMFLWAQGYDLPVVLAALYGEQTGRAMLLSRN